MATFLLIQQSTTTQLPTTSTPTAMKRSSLSSNTHSSNNNNNNNKMNGEHGISNLLGRYTRSWLESSSVLDKLCMCSGGGGSQTLQQVLQDDNDCEEFSSSSVVAAVSASTFADVHDESSNSIRDNQREVVRVSNRDNNTHCQNMNDSTCPFFQPKNGSTTNGPANNRSSPKRSNNSSKWNLFASTAIDMDGSIATLHRTETMPIKNTSGNASITPTAAATAKPTRTFSSTKNPTTTVPSKYPRDNMEETVTTDREDGDAKRESSSPIIHRFFSNVECYSSSQHHALPGVHPPPPPISSADTYTTVSMSHSMDTLLDGEDNDGGILLDDDEDGVFFLSGDQCSIVSAELSHCFRSSPNPYSPSPETPVDSTTDQSQQLSSEITPPPTTSASAISTNLPTKTSRTSDFNNNVQPYRYLLRMKPQNYIHGDDAEEDRIYIQCCSSSSKQLQYPAEVYSRSASSSLSWMDDSSIRLPSLPQF